ncbi:acyl-CoA synthetase long-chain family member 5, isoform CRA_d [Rattus norvegicus]|uniref:Acyl-CoA synthetase long-chain family member 5, isoform CRA_d n=1 Tax=Rattus norvegicus TaxID=10116 RepID=A6JHZ2_RAT|nr:acyl-CoA synthetase long-chain family member 5, isoform CRA_d [Rattus norvegicus]
MKQSLKDCPELGAKQRGRARCDACTAGVFCDGSSGSFSLDFSPCSILLPDSMWCLYL